MAETTGQAKTIDQLPEKASILASDMLAIDDGVQSYRTTWGKLLSIAGGIKSVETTDNSIIITLNDETTKFTITTSDPSKQDKLTFDTAPTPGSSNPVTSGGVYTALSSRDEAISDIQKNAESSTAAIQTNKKAIETLNGDNTTEGSVAHQVTQAIAALVNNAPESLDTLKEIADWITNHAESASAMNTQIQANQKAIESETKRAKDAEAKKAEQSSLDALGLEVVDGILCVVYNK